jgi:hypothetical protein
METINKYKVRVTDNFGNVRIVEFTNVDVYIRDSDTVVIYQKCSRKIKATYPPTYSLEISDVTNGDSSN